MSKLRCQNFPNSQPRLVGNGLKTMNVAKKKWRQIFQYYTVSKKGNPFNFCDYSVKCWLILIRFLHLRKFASKWRISCLNYQVCVQILQNRKTRNILYAFNATTLSCHDASFLQLFQKYVQSPQSPAFIQKFLSKFCFAPWLLKTYRFFIKIRSSSLKPMFTYTKPLTPNCHLLPSNVRLVSE